MLKSMQYNACRSILDLRNTPAYEAAISDLGMKPLSLVVKQRQVEYYMYLKKMNPDSMLSRLLNSLEMRLFSGRRNSWKYVENINSILSDIGFDGIREPVESIRDSYFQRF